MEKIEPIIICEDCGKDSWLNGSFIYCAFCQKLLCDDCMEFEEISDDITVNSCRDCAESWYQHMWGHLRVQPKKERL